MPVDISQPNIPNIDEIINQLRNEFAPMSHKHTGADSPKIDLDKIVLPSYGYIRSGQTKWNVGIGFYLGNDAGTSKFSIGDPAGNHLTFNGVVVDYNGVITTVSGSISAWVINATSLSSTSGGNTTILSSGATAFSAGPTGAPTVTITQAGVLNATGVNITGTITATTGTIGGWTIGATTLTSGATNIILDSGNKAISINNATFGNSGIQLQYNGGTPRAYLGDGANQYFKYDGTNISWKTPTSELDTAGKLTTTSALIGGWIVAATTIADNAVVASAKILIDSGNTLIRVGPTAGNYISINGNLQTIESSNYVSGSAGSGFSINPTRIEIGDIRARGLIRTAVFQKDIISAVGGNFMVLDSDTLNTTMTALDACDLEVDAVGSWAVGDILRIKDDANDEWFEITNLVGAPNYVVTRDKAGSYAANTNPTWKKGATVVNYRQNGDGGIFMTASEADAPYLSVFDHAGSPWTAITTRLRIGNLNGYLGYVADLYGIAIGEATKYLKYDTTNGLRIAGSITASTIDIGANGFHVDVNGNIWWGASANYAGATIRISSAGSIEFTSGYFGGTTNGIQIDATGLKIIGTGYIGTDSTGARIQMVADAGGGYTDGLFMYDATGAGELILRATIGGGWPCLTIFSRDTTGGAQITGMSSTNSSIQFYVKGIGVEDVGVFESNGATARTGLSALRVNLYSDTGDGLYIITDADATGALIKLQANVQKGSNLLEVGATSWTAVHAARITNENYIQFPAYYHCSDFDELIADGTALASSVIAKAYWAVSTDGAGTTTFNVDSNHDKNTHIAISTAATANKYEQILFGRYIGFDQPEVEFRLRVNNITNCVYKFGFYSDATHFAYFHISGADVYLYTSIGAEAGEHNERDTTLNLDTTAWHTFRLKLYGGNIVRVWIDDTEYSIPTPIVNSNPMKILVRAETTAAEDKILYLDYVKIWKGRNDTSDV